MEEKHRWGWRTKKGVWEADTPTWHLEGAGSSTQEELLLSLFQGSGGVRGSKWKPRCEAPPLLMGRPASGRDDSFGFLRRFWALEGSRGSSSDLC